MTASKATTPVARYATKPLALVLGEANEPAAKFATSVAFGAASDVNVVALGKSDDTVSVVALGANADDEKIDVVTLGRTNVDVTDPLNTTVVV